MRISILIVCLFLALSVSSQTRTKKYNSLQDRYEYYENGVMVGYEKYNSLQDQWEYYSTNKSRSSSSGYSDPQSNFDANLAMKVLKYKQDRYDKKVTSIEQFIQRLVESSNEVARNIEDVRVKNKFKKLFSRYLDNEFVDKNLRLLNNPSKHYIVRKRFNDMVINIYKQASKNVRRKEKSYSNSTRSSNRGMYTTTISGTIDHKLRKKPTIGSPVIYRPKQGEKVRVLRETTSASYYKVRIGNHYGFISSGSLSKQYD